MGLILSWEIFVLSLLQSKMPGSTEAKRIGQQSDLFLVELPRQKLKPQSAITGTTTLVVNLFCSPRLYS